MNKDTCRNIKLYCIHVNFLLFLDEKKQMVSSVEKQLEEARELVSCRVFSCSSECLCGLNGNEMVGNMFSHTVDQKFAVLCAEMLVLLVYSSFQLYTLILNCCCLFQEFGMKWTTFLNGHKTFQSKLQEIKDSNKEIRSWTFYLYSFSGMWLQDYYDDFLSCRNIISHNWKISTVLLYHIFQFRKNLVTEIFTYLTLSFDSLD